MSVGGLLLSVVKSVSVLKNVVLVVFCWVLRKMDLGLRILQYRYVPNIATDNENHTVPRNRRVELALIVRATDFGDCDL